MARISGRYIVRMARPRIYTEPYTRKNVSLPDAMWKEISNVRRQTPERIPPEQEVIRRLLREALDARALRDWDRE